MNVGQVEIEAAYWPAKHQLSINIVKVSHSQAERLLRAPGMGCFLFLYVNCFVLCFRNIC
jgi:hypothetical protein